MRSPWSLWFLVVALAGACSSHSSPIDRATPDSPPDPDDVSTPAPSAPSAPSPPAAAAAPSHRELTVMTYNLNFGVRDHAGAIALIRDANADIVLLQETTPGWERSLRQAFGGEYPHIAFRHCCRAGGLGVLSVHAFEPAEYTESPGGWFPSWRLVFDTPLGVMQALNVHLMPPVSQREGYLRSYVRRQAIRIREIETYIGTLATDMPSVIAGDFNENQHGGALALLFERGWRSAVPELLGAVPTWRWNTAHGPLAWQLDHVVFDARFEALEARVIDGGPSDHLPVVVTLAVVGSRDAVVGNQDAETNHVP